MPQPTTPNPVAVDVTQQDWHSTINSNFTGIKSHLEAPLPVKYNATKAGLPAPAEWAKCIALYDSAGSPELVLSNGDQWLDVSLNNNTPYVMYRSSQAKGVNGGTFTSGSWQQRLALAEAFDTHTIAVLANNRVRLPSGTYYCYIKACAYAVNAHQARLNNFTSGLPVLYGTINHSASAGASPQTFSVIEGIFTIEEQSDIEVEHRCETTKATTGLGKFTDLHLNENYVSIEFWKLA